MSDELRDRIWTVIADTLCPGNGGYRLLEHRDAAQAVIDELGLTVEDRNDGSESRTAPDGSIVYGVKSRVAGRWEKQ